MAEIKTVLDDSDDRGRDIDTHVLMKRRRDIVINLTLKWQRIN